VKAIATLIAAALIAGCATVSDPPARLPASEVIVSSVEGQESLALPLSPLEQFCENKVRLAIVLFMAREDNKLTEAEALERVRVVIKDLRVSIRYAGLSMNDADELDFYRMTRDIFRKTKNGKEYIIPVGVYVERFATIEYQSCMAKDDECPLFYSQMTEDGQATQCSEN
jgi:hypothetical protein